jgi:hypothetical protein
MKQEESVISGASQPLKGPPLLAVLFSSFIFFLSFSVPPWCARGEPKVMKI